MIINLTLASKIKTTKDEQWEAVFGKNGELLEFQEAIEDYKEEPKLKHQYNLIDEGIDVCKCLQKWIGKSTPYFVNVYDKPSSQYFDDFESCLQHLQETKIDNYARVAVGLLLRYLVKFCEENQEDIYKHLQLNDKKNRDRGYHN